MGCDSVTGGSRTPPADATFARALWRVPAPVAWLGPAVDDSTVYFANALHQVQAVRTSDGRTRWISSSVGIQFDIALALHVAKGLVLYPQYDIYAFDVGTGALVWTFADSAHTAGGFSRLSSDASRVYGGSASGVVVAVRLLDGTLAWRTKVSADTGQVNVYSPLVSGNTVYAGYLKYSPPFTGGLVALDASTGAVRWSQDLPPVSPNLWGGAAFDAVKVWQDLVVVSCQDGTVRAFRSDSGTAVWTSPRPSGLAAGVNDPRPLAVAGDVLVVGSDLTMVQGLDARTGALVWTRNIPAGGSLNYPIVSMGDTFLLRYTSLQVARLVGGTGSILWQTLSVSEPEILALPAFDSTQVYVATGAGFFALRR